MTPRDRLTALLLLGLAVAAWVAVAWLLANRSPVGDPMVVLTGAVLMGGAFGLTMWPLLWLAGFMRQGGGHEAGDWGRAGRRALIVSLTVTVLIMLRGQSTLTLPLALFVVTLAILVELAFSLRR
jgi:hypothetical protein